VTVNTQIARRTIQPSVSTSLSALVNAIFKIGLFSMGNLVLVKEILTEFILEELQFI
jgi:hypothetical protein